jgi:hypothetical protein
MSKSALEFGLVSWFLLYLSGGEEGGREMARGLSLAYLGPFYMFMNGMSK